MNAGRPEDAEKARREGEEIEHVCLKLKIKYRRMFGDHLSFVSFFLIIFYL